MSDEVTVKIDRFFSRYQLRHYAKGQILLVGGEDTEKVFNLVKGRVKQYDVSYRGDEVILNVFKPPAFFPMSIAINHTPNPYVYEADTDVDIRQAPSVEVIDFMKANPDVMFDLLGRVYRGMDGLLGRMSLLMSSSAKSRLMYELILEARRFGISQTDGGFMLNINEIDLGARAGLSRETVNREMHKLKQDGLIEVRAKSIVIKDVGLLEQKLGMES